ncbi:MAG: hypothetical protein IPN93_12785 [Bacteroidetes bacterium]|jgi:hypothetical protein|nr:hypothetical protein [Bacteroidota bacterium]
MKKEIVIVTSKGRCYYRISEYDRKFYVYREGTGFFDSDKEIGSARTLDDAITVAKADAPGSFEKIEFRN